MSGRDEMPEKLKQQKLVFSIISEREKAWDRMIEKERKKNMMSIYNSIRRDTSLVGLLVTREEVVRVEEDEELPTSPSKRKGFRFGRRVKRRVR